jgi:hypothetical protein
VSATPLSAQGLAQQVSDLIFFERPLHFPPPFRPILIDCERSVILLLQNHPDDKDQSDDDAELNP